MIKVLAQIFFPCESTSPDAEQHPPDNIQCPSKYNNQFYRQGVYEWNSARATELAGFILLFLVIPQSR